MQYDLDIKGEFSQIFKKVRDILLSYPEIKELKNAKQTSYSDKYGVIIMMRPKGNQYVLAFGKGYKLAESYPMLQGAGKIVRHLHVKSVNEVDEALIRELIEESIVLGMEAYELRKLRCSLKS